MTRGQVKSAESYAIVHLFKWVEFTGAIDLNSGYHSELESIAEDAVHIGIQMALEGKVEFVTNNNCKELYI